MAKDVDTLISEIEEMVGEQDSDDEPRLPAAAPSAPAVEPLPESSRAWFHQQFRARLMARDVDGGRFREDWSDEEIMASIRSAEQIEYNEPPLFSGVVINPTPFYPEWERYGNGMSPQCQRPLEERRDVFSKHNVPDHGYFELVAVQVPPRLFFLSEGGYDVHGYSFNFEENYYYRDSRYDSVMLCEGMGRPDALFCEVYELHVARRRYEILHRLKRVFQREGRDEADEFLRHLRQAHGYEWVNHALGVPPGIRTRFLEYLKNLLNNVDARSV